MGRRHRRHAVDGEFQRQRASGASAGGLPGRDLSPRRRTRPRLGVRTIAVVVTDGDGGTSNTGTGTGQPGVGHQRRNRSSVNLNGTPTYIEGGAAVVLDADVTIFDAELSAANNFNGATLTLTRNGGADAQDVFYSGAGTLSLFGGNVNVSGITIGTYVSGTGTLELTFNGQRYAGAGEFCDAANHLPQYQRCAACYRPG